MFISKVYASHALFSSIQSTPQFLSGCSWRLLRCRAMVCCSGDTKPLGLPELSLGTGQPCPRKAPHTACEARWVRCVGSSEITSICTRFNTNCCFDKTSVSSLPLMKYLLVKQVEPNEGGGRERRILPACPCKTQNTEAHQGQPKGTVSPVCFPP